MEQCHLHICEPLLPDTCLCLVGLAFMYITSMVYFVVLVDMSHRAVVQQA